MINIVNVGSGIPGFLYHCIAVIVFCTFSVLTPIAFFLLWRTCDHNLCFIDIYVWWPGSVHDVRVFRNSPLYQSAEHNLFQDDAHLLGDSAYPLQRCKFIH